MYENPTAQGNLPSEEAILAQYAEICKSYHAIAEFRAKLLALLPIVSGGGIAALLSRQPAAMEIGHLSALGLFGLAVTIGLFMYELRGIQRCKTLIDLGALFEQKLGISDGQFGSRPKRIWGFIGSESAGWVVYPAVMLGWAYLLVIGLSGQR